MSRATYPMLFAIAMSSLISCATPSRRAPEVAFSGVAPENVRDIQALVARRPDILKPVLRVNLISAGRIEVVTGRDQRVGDVSDTFSVAKRHGQWDVASAVNRDSIVVTSQCSY